MLTNMLMSSYMNKNLEASLKHTVCKTHLIHINYKFEISNRKNHTKDARWENLSMLLSICSSINKFVLYFRISRSWYVRTKLQITARWTFGCSFLEYRGIEAIRKQLYDMWACFYICMACWNSSHILPSIECHIFQSHDVFNRVPKNTYSIASHGTCNPFP